ncbi:efflux pump antibiotic resistance protein [Aspergillus homomorphus CBS 101889]|uniref:Efflux pump antibiotic resistance protein n=1 Tax=Aspergillus homomorphus (strain CBS 101889) TaxID=1450537 RepID=A0A395IB05_ASPHC|nr:efflux pump antibiotic resistance protein [Aspergillus homomorphus CBS 101889]RAL16313.1 efflux pump antibiotic resistance protein [Aspergillus homomorphus CBS 101889]
MTISSASSDTLRTEVDVDETTPLNPAALDTSVANASNYQSISKGPTSDARSSHDTDEERPLVSPAESHENNKVQALASVKTIIAVLLLGEFISNADTTLVMATTGKISSEFDRLREASWLATAFTLGLCAAQPMYGKLSDIYGRKPLLLWAYFFFGLGCVISGIGSSMFLVILGRAISGIGGAGTMAMGVIIITDIVPRRDVAHWRAYINIAMTLGRSAGGPIGGWLTDTVGWRWSFLLQGPLSAMAALLAIWKLKLTAPATNKDIRRVDFIGTFFLAVGVITTTLILDQAGKAFAWASLTTAFLATLSMSAFISFVVIELYVAPEPIFDLRILRRTNVTLSYLIGSLQITAQVGMMFSVPLYFQITSRASATVAGGHLVPAVIGNTLGGLIAGAFIRRTGQFKVFLIVAGLVASVTYLLLFLRWNGHTGFWESLYIIPGGMGTGFASAAAFVSMTAFLLPQEIAMATGGYFLLFNFSMTAGVTVTNSVLGTVFKRQLEQNLTGPGARRIIERALSDTSYINELSGHVHDIVVHGYVAGLRYTYWFSLALSLFGSLLGWSVRKHQLRMEETLQHLQKHKVFNQAS